MILDVNQIKSAGKNMFQVSNNGQIIYTADSPWMPMGTDNTTRLTLANMSGQVVYYTHYNIIDNLAEAVIPFKYLITGSQRFNQVSVHDIYGNFVGSFYKEFNALFDGKLYMLFGNRALVAYAKGVGDREVVSIYENNMQVGQITRSNAVNNNLDSYRIHMLDGYEMWIPVISLFTVYIDFIMHNSSGEMVVGYKVSKSYSYDANNDKYDPNFVLRYFGQVEHDGLLGKGPRNIKPTPMVGNMTLKTFWIVFGACWGVALLATGIALMFYFDII